jgi:hypothetical protein
MPRTTRPSRSVSFSIVGFPRSWLLGLVGAGLFVAALVFPRAAHADAPPALSPAKLFGRGGPLAPLPPSGPPPSREAPVLQPLSWDGGLLGTGPIAAAVFNPALAPVGKWSVRLEGAVAPFLSFYVEPGSIDIDIPGLFRVSGASVELGAHVYPQGRWLSGFYFGPRVLTATGENDTAKTRLTGFGGDLGYQVVVSVVAINLGLGVMAGKAVAEPKGAAVGQVAAAGKKELGSWSGPLPVAMLGIGFAL